MIVSRFFLSATNSWQPKPRQESSTVTREVTKKKTVPVRELDCATAPPEQVRATCTKTVRQTTHPHLGGGDEACPPPESVGVLAVVLVVHINAANADGVNVGIYRNAGGRSHRRLRRRLRLQRHE